MDRAHFEKLESLFPRLLASLNQKFPDGRLSVGEHFFNHGEYGLALEELAATIKQSDCAISKEEFEIIFALSDLMNMRDNDLIKMLQDRCGK